MLGLGRVKSRIRGPGWGLTRVMGMEVRARVRVKSRLRLWLGLG